MANFKRGPAFAMLRRLTRRLAGADIHHAVVGDFAVFAHGATPALDAVEVLVNAIGFDEFKRQLVPGNYLPVPGKSRRFVDPASNQPLTIRLAGHRPGIGERTPVTYPEPIEAREMIDGIFYIKCRELIALKLGAQRSQDTADAIRLIQAQNLDNSFQRRLHPFVHDAFSACLDEIQREEDFLARNG